MKFRYWTIALQPDPTLLDRQGIGVVVEREDGASTAQFISPADLRTAGMTPEARAASRAILGVLRAEIEPLTADDPILPLESETPLGAFMSTTAARWHNAARIHSEGTLSTEMLLEEAAEYLYAMFVRRTPTPRSNAYRELRKKVQELYEAETHLSPLVHRNPRVNLGGSEAPTDLAVIEGTRVRELVRSVPFNITPETRHEQSVDSWTLRIFNLRRTGGFLLHEDRELKLEEDVPVSVMYAPPTTEEQWDAFERATMNWSDFGIGAVSVKEAGPHVANLAARIGV